MRAAVTTTITPTGPGPECSDPTRHAGNPSAILRRIADDLRVVVVPDEARSTTVRVEGVLTHRIGSFRADIDVHPRRVLREVPWVRSCVRVPPSTYFDPTPERLITLVAEELTPHRGMGYRASGALLGRRVNVAFCSPNANKPLHLGHARNMMLGAAVGNLLELAGAGVRRSCCISDYGMHIFQALAAYLRGGAGATPESTGEKPDHFVGRFYSSFGSDPALASGSSSPPELMARWMAGSVTVREHTRVLASWAEAGFDETFDAWAIRFDHRFRETREHPCIEEFLAREARSGRVRRDDAGRWVVVLPPHGEAVPLTRSDGSPLYMSHMVAAVLQRLETFGPGVQTLMTITGDEQVIPFRQLAAVLRVFGYATDVELRHVCHGLVRVEGRSLSSREGTTATVDDVVDRLAVELGAGEEPPGSNPARARAVLGLYLLARSMDKPIDYRAAECLRTAGHMAADLAAALRHTQAPPAEGAGTVDPRTYAWITTLAAYPTVLDRAATRPDPSILLRYVTRLCREFVALHARGRIEARLLAPTREVVRHALGLLNLPAEPDVLAATRPTAFARHRS